MLEQQSTEGGSESVAWTPTGDGTILNSFYETRMTLIQKPDKVSLVKKIKLHTNILMNQMQKSLTKYFKVYK